MPVGEERRVKPIILSDGTLLFMYYKYPLRQAFGGVLAEPIVSRHEGGEYRVRYQARDAEGRDRLEGARPIVTRDWVRSKWLNEYLVGLDELRLMGSLGGSGGPERELYAILSEPTYRDRLACYASKFPDESGSRLIVLNWVGPLADPAGARVTPAAADATASRAASPVAPGSNVARGPSRPPRIELPSGELPSTVVPLAHQRSPAPPAQSIEVRRDEADRTAAPREGAAPLPHRSTNDEDPGTRKIKLGLDSTQPVPIQPFSASPSSAGAQAGQRPTDRPAAPPADDEQEMTPRTRVEAAAAGLPSRVVPLAHQVTPPAPAPAADTDRDTAMPPPIERAHSIVSPAPVEALESIEPQPSPIERPITLEPPSPLASPSSRERSTPAEAPPPIERRRSIDPVDVPSRSDADSRTPEIDRRTAARPPGENNSSLPPLWIIAGVSLFGFCLLIAGWWLRGASESSTIAVSPPRAKALGAVTGSTGGGEPQSDIDRPGGPAGATSGRHGVAADGPAANVAGPEDVPGDVGPTGDAASVEAAVGEGTARETTADRVTPRVDRAGPISGSGAAGATPRGRPGQEAAGTAPDARHGAPVSSPKPQPTPPAPVAIEAPLLAQGGAIASKPSPADVQDWEAEVPDNPPPDHGKVAQKPPLTVDTVAPRPAPAPVEPGVPTLKLTNDQISGAQRNYLARVIRFLEPPLKYEWTPKYMRPGFFVSLVTDGEAPECRIDFKEPTAITFDLIIRGGSGTESRIENVELLYR